MSNIFTAAMGVNDLATITNLGDNRFHVCLHNFDVQGSGGRWYPLGGHTELLKNLQNIDSLNCMYSAGNNAIAKVARHGLISPCATLSNFKLIKNSLYGVLEIDPIHGRTIIEYIESGKRGELGFGFKGECSVVNIKNMDIVNIHSISSFNVTLVAFNESVETVH